jgi:hypothetical protein
MPLTLFATPIPAIAWELRSLGGLPRAEKMKRLGNHRVKYG